MHYLYIYSVYNGLFGSNNVENYIGIFVFIILWSYNVFIQLQLTFNVRLSG